MNCLSPARKNELGPPTSYLPAAGAGRVPLESQTPQTFLDGSYLHVAELGRVETAVIWLPPSQEVGLHCHCVYTALTRTGLEVLITSPKNTRKKHSVRGSELWLTVVGLECVPSALHLCLPIT